MRKKFENILKEHGIYGEDIEKIMYAVHDMLTFMADKIDEEEPYATKTVKEYNDAAYKVYCLCDVLQLEE